MKTEWKRFFCLFTCLVLFLSASTAALAAPGRGHTIASAQWESGSFLVEQLGGGALYFELTDDRRSNAGNWVIQLEFDTGTALKIDFEKSWIILYAYSMSGNLVLADSVPVKTYRSGSLSYGWADIPAAWSVDVPLWAFSNAGVVFQDGGGGTELVADVSKPDRTPAYNTHVDGVYFGTLWNAERKGPNWNVEITVSMYDLYSDRYVRSLRVGDEVEVGFRRYTVDSVSPNAVSFYSGFFTPYNIDWSHPDLVPNGYWVASGPSGAILTYPLGTATYPTDESVRFVDNTSFEERPVPSPLDLLAGRYGDNGVPVLFTVENGILTRVESIYLP